MTDIDGLHALTNRIRKSRRGVVLSGAGMSTESGIPDFRSRMGLWRDADPMRYATREGLLADPEGFYAFWRPYFASLATVRPNQGHYVVAALERAGLVRAVVTQNVDGLHQAAGSSTVHEVHGTFRTVRCMGCGLRASSAEAFAQSEGAPRCSACGSLVRPDVVLFGEMLGPVFEDATESVRAADFLLVLGSSLEVAPVSGLVPFAATRGVPVAIVNREPTNYDGLADVVVRAELGPSLQEIAARLGLPGRDC